MTTPATATATPITAVRPLDRCLLAANACSFTLAMALLAAALFPSLRSDDPVGALFLGLAMLLGRPLAAGR